jgi:molybdopterin/thiamine biosynthesis adenylyltransferase
MRFSEAEVERYARHLVLKEVGGPGQQRLAQARVGVVGLGGLGGPAALHLAAAGVGRLRLIDPDHVSLSNLQRQVLFDSADVGRPKVEAGAEALLRLNPHIAIEPHAQPLTRESAAALLTGCDLVLDGLDSFAARLAVNAACHAMGLMLVSGAVGRWSGQVGVFASGPTRSLPAAERAPCYACLVGEAPADAEACAAVGVVGALTGVIGAMMALEAIKLITGAGAPLVGRLLLYEGLAGEARVIRLPRDPGCPVCAREATPD